MCHMFVCLKGYRVWPSARSECLHVGYPVHVYSRCSSSGLI